LHLVKAEERTDMEVGRLCEQLRANPTISIELSDKDETWFMVVIS